MSLSGSLRAGHSITQSMQSASVEMPAPMSEELARIVNADRVGQPASESMAEVGRRMQCEDFEWLSQAIEINREVGGDLAGVLDHVAETVRERAQIKGQVRALAAEGKFSAYILIALPFFVASLHQHDQSGIHGCADAVHAGLGLHLSRRDHDGYRILLDQPHGQDRILGAAP